MLSWDKAHKYYEYDEEAGNLIYKERPKDTFTKEGLYKRHLAWVGKKAGGRCVGGYLHVIVDGRYYLGHKVMWLLKYNEWVKYPDFEIDHIDGDTMNNRLSNLRKVTKSQNQKNAGQRVNNTSGVHGVNWKKRYTSDPSGGRWVARIWDGPKHVYLGEFVDIEDAKKARKEAEIRLGYTGTNRPAKGKGNVAEQCIRNEARA